MNSAIQPARNSNDSTGGAVRELCRVFSVCTKNHWQKGSPIYGKHKEQNNLVPV